MKYFILTIVLFLKMCSLKATDLQIDFYNGENKLSYSIDINSIKSVDWENQIYYLDEKALIDLKRCNLLNGKVKFLLSGIEIFEIVVVSIYGAELPSSLFIPCYENGQLKIQDNISIFEISDSSGKKKIIASILANKKLYNHLKVNGKFK